MLLHFLAETPPSPHRVFPGYSSHPFSMYKPGRWYFDILRYYPGQRYFDIKTGYPILIQITIHPSSTDGAIVIRVFWGIIVVRDTLTFWGIIRVRDTLTFWGIILVRDTLTFWGIILVGDISAFLLVRLLGQRRKRCVVFSLSTGFITRHNPMPALMNSLNSCSLSILSRHV